MFYVYEWYNVETGEVFYVGKGTGKRYKVLKHNDLFNEYVASHSCSSRIVMQFDNESDAFEYERKHILELWADGQCQCNIYIGGTGGTKYCWTEEMRKRYSENNVMKRPEQRERMRTSNPMSNVDTARKVARKLGRAIVVGATEYSSVVAAAEGVGVSEPTIRAWCRKGKSPHGEPCFYADGNPVQEVSRRPYKHKLSSMSRAVIVDDIEFESTAAAARFLNSTVSNLKVAIKRDGHYKGHICRYANQQPSQGKSDSSTLEGSTTNG